MRVVMSCPSTCGRARDVVLPCQRRSASSRASRVGAERLLEAERRLRQDLAVERYANEAYEYYRAHGRDKQGRRLGRPPKPYEPPETPPRKINTTDLDSRNVKTPRSYTQGYNAQAVVNEEQIVLAAEPRIPRSWARVGNEIGGAASCRPDGQNGPQ